MRSNVWIRKDNEQAWSEITDKSAFVNAAIQKDYSQPIAKPIQRIAEVKATLPGKCPHGYNLKTSNCKYGCKK